MTSSAHRASGVALVMTSSAGGAGNDHAFGREGNDELYRRQRR